MNKNTLIGLILIFGLFLGYSLYLSPSKAEREEQQRLYDSAMAAQQAVRDSLALLPVADNPTDALAGDDTLQSPGTMSYKQKTSRFAAFAKASEPLADMADSISRKR